MLCGRKSLHCVATQKYTRRLLNTSKTSNVIFVLGGPGSGKGTQCQKIQDTFAWTHLSAGELLRKEQDKASENGLKIAHSLREGSIVPAEITVSLLKDEMARNRMENNQVHYLIDGFPRNQENLDVWREIIGDSINIEFCLFIDCPLEILETRLLSRGKLGNRSDDNIVSIKKRFKTHEECEPVLEYFRKAGKLRIADGSKTPENVFDQISSYFQSGNGDE